MTNEQTDELIAVLKRIGEALEKIAYPPVVVNHLPGGSNSNMYQCTVCKTWVVLGAFHSCPGKANYGTFYVDPPSTNVNPERCPYFTAASMQCQLGPGHAGAHKIL